MPYAFSHWDLAEAVNHLRRNVGCTPAAAQKLVRGILTDAALGFYLPSIIEWESLIEGLPARFDPLPFDAEYWRKVRIRGAKVYDPHGNCWRTLWVLREVILQHWPEHSENKVPSPKQKRDVPRTDHRDADARLFARMAAMIADGSARNVTDAARAVVDTAPGTGKSDNKVRRLVSHYLAAARRP